MHGLSSMHDGGFFGGRHIIRIDRTLYPWLAHYHTSRAYHYVPVCVGGKVSVRAVRH